jgi:hypothetical protein
MLPIRTGNAGGDMAAVMARVRKMSDSQLAAILAGKDVSVPQFAAMTEAMGRKQLRQAMDGQQAQQQAQQPSVKDQLLAEQSAPSQGIAGLPAPNMEAMGEGMAGGGIIAFEQGGDVPGYAGGNYIDPDEARKRRQAAMWESVRPDNKPYLAEDFRADAASFFDPIAGFFTMRDAKDLEKAKKMQTADQPVDYDMYTPVPVDYSMPAAEAPKTDKAAAPASTKKETVAATEKEDSKTETAKRDFLSRFEGTGDRMRGDVDKLKQQGLGEALMRAGAGFLSRPTLAGGAAAGLGALAESGAASRKELREVEKAASEYEFNLAKAQEAAAQGNDDLAYKYMALADQSKYRAGILGIKGQEVGMQKSMYDMVKIPAQLSKVYSDATKAVKDATANRPVKPAEFQKMVDDEYRKRAKSVGLGDYIDTYSPSTSLPTVSQLPKGVSAMKLPDDA